MPVFRERKRWSYTIDNLHLPWLDVHRLRCLQVLLVILLRKLNANQPLSSCIPTSGQPKAFFRRQSSEQNKPVLNPGNDPRILNRLIKFEELTLRLSRHNLHDWFRKLDETRYILRCNLDGRVKADTVRRGFGGMGSGQGGEGKNGEEKRGEVLHVDV